MNTFYKATRLDGTDFCTGTVDYGAALATGEIIHHPARVSVPGDASTYFSVATDPVGTLLGGEWPCRLFQVEPHGEARSETRHRFKFACSAMSVSKELNPSLALGPQGAEVAEFILGLPAALDAAWDAARSAAWDAARDAARSAARDAARSAAWDAARDAARSAARSAAWDAARDAALDAARDAARDAALDAAWDAARSAVAALVVRDLIAPSQFDACTAPWKILTGKDD